MFIFEFINVIIEVLITLFCCGNVYTSKQQSNITKSVIILLAIGISTFTGTLRLGTAINLSLYFCICFALLLLLYEGAIKNKLFFSAMFIITSFIADILATVVITFFGIEYGMSGGDNITYIVGAMLSNFIRLWLLAYVSKILGRKIQNLPMAYWFFVFVCPILSIACMVIFDIYLMQAQQVNAVLVFVPLFCILYINFMLFCFFETFSEQMRLKVIERLAQSEEENYKLLQENEIELRTLKHDMKNHIMMLNEYLSRNDTKTALNHLSDIQHTLEGLSVLICTSNPALDAAINIGARRAQAESVEYKVQIIGNTSVKIEAGDICRLLSNAIDNAIEAAVKCRDGYVYIEISITDDVIKIHIENSTVLCKLDFSTSKEDKKNHGFGIKNIKGVVKKYNGTMNAQIVSDIFNLDITLQNIALYDVV